MTFGYSLSSEAVVMRQLRRWKRLWRRSLTHSRWSIFTTNPERPSSISQHHQTVRLLPRYGIAISTLMQLEPYVGSFPCISSCLMVPPSDKRKYMEKIQHKISQENRGWVGNETSVSDFDRKYIFIQPFLTHCSCRSSYFSKLRWCAQLKFSSKRPVNSITKTFFALTDQRNIWMLCRKCYFSWKYEVMF